MGGFKIVMVVLENELDLSIRRRPGADLLKQITRYRDLKAKVGLEARANQEKGTSHKTNLREPIENVDDIFRLETNRHCRIQRVFGKQVFVDESRSIVYPCPTPIDSKPK